MFFSPMEDGLELFLNARICSKTQLSCESSSLGLLCTQPFHCLDPKFIGIGLECIAKQGLSGMPASVDPAGRVCVFPECLKDTFAYVTSVWAFWLLKY